MSFALCKDDDSLAATLSIAARLTEDRDLPYAATVSGRAAAILTPVADPRYWMSPALPPFAALEAALRALGMQAAAAPADALADDRSFAAACRKMLRSGPLICGPLDRAALWRRVNFSYWRGSAHFVLLLQPIGRDMILTHDPEGAPAMPRRADHLFRALLPSPDAGLVGLRAARAPVPLRRILGIALDRCVEARVLAAARPDGGGAGLRRFADMISAADLVGSRRAALDLALRHRARALVQLGILLGDLRCGIAHGPVIGDYARECARACRAVGEADVGQVAGAVRGMAAGEDALAELFVGATI